MSKVSIEDMGCTVSTMGEDYIIFSRIAFDAWDDSPDRYMWSVIAYHYKTHNGVFMNHPHNYIRGYAIMFKHGQGLTNFETAKEDMEETTGVIERLLRYTQFADIEITKAKEIEQWLLASI